MYTPHIRAHAEPFKPTYKYLTGRYTYSYRHLIVNTLQWPVSNYVYNNYKDNDVQNEIHDITGLMKYHDIIYRVTKKLIFFKI